MLRTHVPVESTTGINVYMSFYGAVKWILPIATYFKTPTSYQNTFA